MLIATAIVGLILAIVGYVIYLKTTCTEELGETLAWIGVVIFAISLIAMPCVGAKIATSHTIDEKIALYEQENQIIEEKLELSVSTYLEYEQETLTSLTPENAANFVCLYPELSADTLMQKQIEAYLSNHAAIVKLKVEKINLAKAKWWLYFGA